MVSLVKYFDVGTPTVICSCGQLIDEMDSMHCQECGDVMCHDCVTECIECAKSHCVNCNENNAECIKCHINPPRKVEDKAFLVIDGEATAIQNSKFMIQKTSISNARDLTLKLDGRTFQYTYRSICLREDNGNDYFIHFEEIIEDSNFESLMQSLEDYHSKSGYYNEDDDIRWHFKI